MKNNSFLISTFHQSKTTWRNFGTLNLRIKRRLSFGKVRRKFTGKELDPETGLYYYGARYLDPKTSRWLSGDPAMAEYLPSAPVNDEARKRNGNLPGQGGVFNHVNLHVYHYAGNNPVRYTDPTGRKINLEQGEGVSNEDYAKAQQMYDDIKNSNTKAGRRFRELDNRTDFTVTVNINASGPSNTDAKNKDNATNGRGSGSVVNININDSGNLEWESVAKDMGASLVHEIAGHAYDNYRGTNPYHGTSGHPKTTWNARFRSEQNAVAMENEYRDYKGLDQRTLYVINGWPLDMPIFRNGSPGSYFFARNSMIVGNTYYRLSGNRIWKEN